jgi:hypothetical protein
VFEIVAMVLGSLARLGMILLLEIAVILMATVVDWFLDWMFEVQSDESKLAVTVAEDIAAGNVSYVQGIFDTDTAQFTQARRIRGRSADAGIRRAHSTHQVAVWE